MNIVITLLSVIFILFLPGFFWSFVFFQKGKIDVIERIALSFALSIAIVPLVVFYGNLIGIKITSISVMLYILGIIAIALTIIMIKSWKKTS